MKIQFLLTVLLVTFSVVACRTTIGYGGNHFKSQKIKYEAKKRNTTIQILYQNDESIYLEKLKSKYPITTIFDKNETDIEKILKVLNWANSRWEHNGMNAPKNDDAISILEEAEEGKRFPCFAYAIVLRDQLSAIGYKARTVYLKTKKAEKSKKTPGHVVTEVYLNSIKKWVFLDGQFNFIPMLYNKPLNAIEFQNAITFHSEDLILLSLNEIAKAADYISWVYPYLYYLDTSLDNRYSPAAANTIDGKKSLMLVPIGAKHLSRINFWDLKIDYCIYTNSILDFYAKPS